MSLADSLARIETWLAAHAPRILRESLNPGAEPAMLDALETAVGRPLPADYRALYQRFDGLNENADNFGSFFYGISFLPSAQVTANYQYRASDAGVVSLTKALLAIKRDNALNPHWLRMGFDGSHVWLCLDLDPAPDGQYGQIILLDEENETAFVVADSVAGLLSEFALDLEENLYVLNPDALEDGDQYLSPVQAIDVVNWCLAERWQAVKDL
ncbi:SMI1/KNR4 family protein [Hymenobacter actinosclerus]|uniref:Cell wall assembly regulator SMI1 n=1 Tax=Hymenobacter actinosclerus TaxID=82805 RepID=A0A1I0EGF4_9BACT|nr:SMI1/KNR4 family protein [Hymenobacter actinosclerus]SET44137.1 Cell wall assembly regulator SMI1 [Hymenobacter actinosclerus]